MLPAEAIKLVGPIFFCFHASPQVKLINDYPSVLNQSEITQTFSETCIRERERGKGRRERMTWRNIFKRDKESNQMSTLTLAGFGIQIRILKR